MRRSRAASAVRVLAAVVGAVERSQQAPRALGAHVSAVRDVAEHFSRVVAFVLLLFAAVFAAALPVALAALVGGSLLLAERLRGLAGAGLFAEGAVQRARGLSHRLADSRPAVPSLPPGAPPVRRASTRYAPRGSCVVVAPAMGV